MVENKYNEKTLGIENGGYGIGCYPEMSNEHYHGDKNSISRSALMDFDKSAYTYWAKHLNPNRPKKDATKQMELGSAFHTLILEQHLFDKYYAIRPPKVLLKDVGRDQYEIYKALCESLEKEGRIVIEEDDYATLKEMQAKILSNDKAMGLIRDSRIENSFFWQDEHSGLLLKARPDILHDHMIVDLKTCSDASPRAFQHEMMKYGYHIQGAMVREAVRIIEDRIINHVINICIETKYPHNMAIYIIDLEAIEAGHLKFKQLCLDLKSALEENKFIDYGIQTIGLPKWAF